MRNVLYNIINYKIKRMLFLFVMPEARQFMQIFLIILETMYSKTKSRNKLVNQIK